jgi:tRNA(fMet)-specific endonuclease VapC
MVLYQATIMSNAKTAKIFKQVLSFESGDAEEAGEIRSALERMGTPIGPYDVLVAAQARRRDALLVTANEREFARVPRLKFEDWAITE